ncbi:AB hydrolase-1 domain-containing protein [Frankia sp. Hr75.2]|nr:AB hydrolase-1 domain-containing protein [Frankia sp. Hr75.2]
MTTAAPGLSDVEAGFEEGLVEADGFRIRYRASGDGPPLVHLTGGHGLVLTPGHGLLSRNRRVIAFELPGLGAEPNERTTSMEELAGTLLSAIGALGIGEFDLWGTSFGAKVACWSAIQAPDRVSALALESPGAIRPDGWTFPRLREEEGALRTQRRAFVQRLVGPARDRPFEQRLQAVATPTLVLFGTEDPTIDTDAVAHLYKELLPNASLVYVYAAAHAISADRPEAFADVVDDYLERHQTFVVGKRATRLFP